jgi:hypothetical protein
MFPVFWFLNLTVLVYAYTGPIFHDKWVPLTKAWRYLRIRMEGRCEYFEKVAKDSRQGVVLQVGEALTMLHRKMVALLRNVNTYFGPGMVLW